MRLKEVNRRDRRRFIATFSGYKILGNAKGVAERMVFTDVEDDNYAVVSKYTWFNGMKAFKNLNLEIGDKVLFTARVVDFRNIYTDARYGKPEGDDYIRLMNPTKAIKLKEPVHRLYPDYKEDKPCRISIKPTKRY